MLSRESDTLAYKYPRTEEDMAESNRLHDAADDFYAAAKALDADEGLWLRALRKWDGEP